MNQYVIIVTYHAFGTADITICPFVFLNKLSVIFPITWQSCTTWLYHTILIQTKNYRNNFGT